MQAAVKVDRSERDRRNLRTGLILASVSFAFVLGFVLRRIVFA